MNAWTVGRRRDVDMDDQPDGHASGGSRAARKRAKKRLRKMPSDNPAMSQPSKRPKQASMPTPVAANDAVAPSSIMRFDEVLSAQSSEEVAERLFELANASQVLFHINGYDVTIHQDPSVVGTGGCIWDTAFVLAR